MSMYTAESKQGGDRTISGSGKQTKWANQQEKKYTFRKLPIFAAELLTIFFKLEKCMYSSQSMQTFYVCTLQFYYYYFTETQNKKIGRFDATIFIS